MISDGRRGVIVTDVSAQILLRASSCSGETISTLIICGFEIILSENVRVFMPTPLARPRTVPFLDHL